MNIRLPFSLTLLSSLVLMLGLTIASPVFADSPPAALLLDEVANPYSTTGIRVSVSNLGSVMRGLTTDDTTVYVMNTSGNIVSVPLSSIDPTPGQSQQNIAGTMHTVGWGSDGAPSLPGNVAPLSIAYSRGCIFITNSSNTVGEIELYCIDVSDYSVTEIEVPNDKPLPAGSYFTYSNLINFPDGRIGKVSGYVDMGGGIYQSTLRLYTIAGTGKNATLTWSEDILMNDSSNWATDEHGIGTDGTFLYRIQWRDYNPDTKVWQLASGVPSEVVYAGEYAKPFGNMHYLSHNHTDNYYLIGHFDGTEFFITSSADPGPGPGNPLTPVFSAVTSTTDGFVVSITNHDPSFTWTVDVSAGQAVIDENGVVTVTGLPAGGSATITVTSQKSGIPDGSAGLLGSAIPDDGDGVSAAEENGAPNGGDGNGDGIPDSEQATVTSLKNTEVSSTAYLTLAIDDADCSALSGVSISGAPADSGFTYPVGLLHFNAACVSGASTTVTIYYDQDYDTSEWVARKYINGAYTTIQDAVFVIETIGGTPVTTLIYELVDGGPLDADGVVNGVIVDPVGPAVPVAQESVSQRTTGGTRFGCKDPSASNYNQFSIHDQKLCEYGSEPSATSVCAPYIGSYIKYGADNDAEEVAKLERFLNEKQGESLPIDGVYSMEDMEAVKRFQQKYASEVLGVWGLSEPTGYVYRTTLMKINSFYCNQNLTCPAFTEYNSLTENSVSAEVAKTKTLLTELGFYEGPINVTFDTSLDASLRNFQQTFGETMLKPWGITSGTGYKYKTTNKFLNLLVGCKTEAVELDGRGTFDY